MTKSVFIFTFSPVQPFIAEARRTSDLFVGSRILSELAKAAARALQQYGQLVYPFTLAEDAPNQIVAVIEGDIKQAAQAALQAFEKRWEEIARSAWDTFSKLVPQHQQDQTLDEIWQRQRQHFWETFWASATMAGDDYAEAYHRARRALDAAKRSRLFDPVSEPGVKDTLSGAREALHPRGLTSLAQVRSFWGTLARQVDRARLLPDGRERLDSIGVIKRFCDLEGDRRFPSTSTVAALDFIERAKSNSVEALRRYRDALRQHLADALYKVQEDSDWPFDGELLYEETLSPARLEESFGVSLPEQARKALLQALNALYESLNCRPTPYYAILMLDGDNMGQRISECLKASKPLFEHQTFSQKLSIFAEKVRKKKIRGLVYNGGDDVLALLPLAQALRQAEQLAEEFRNITGGTASAGIALVHHLSPLGNALRAAREAEQSAKGVPNKNALCTAAVKRSGEREQVRMHWDDLFTFNQLVDLLGSGKLSMRFATDASESALSLSLDVPEMFAAELRRQANRHRNKELFTESKAREFAQELAAWAQRLPDGIEGFRSALGVARFIVRETVEVEG
ncbi:MAG: type III-B CRISPR-associated protein Cas10/Cmr2 [Thermoflexales bacterium]|nr:type III-B CRISPR-associated protein Cas10/Cmr2 [Thermoflexales bacterium]MCX7939738.1 type III-B CRISPR-associated protein Cas10/Cmr2 [Thermoflexales bacterium]MDW8054378.1 type III-B CRISPR-associated protein Cas10/Cmr2 [Anaerolineae bacterium]MDW8292821.1 type III-B CRISPR-associated protein Cas10/Cmr2 [Anaerolineae bacterium]